MKVVFLSLLVAGTMAATANASDMGYTETETYTNHEVISIETITYSDNAYVAPRAKPCGCAVKSSIDLTRPCPCTEKRLAPINVKTHTEVIDHYAVIEPVVNYRVAGTYAQRRVVPTTCTKCVK